MQLSSSATLFYKIVFPAFWLGVFGFVAIPAAFKNNPPSTALDARVIFPAMGLVCLGAISWLGFSLKRVWLGPTSLRVRGLFKEVEIPLADIERVSSFYLASPESVTVTLRRPSAFGSRIRFIASLRFARFEEPPAAARLRERIAALPK